MDLNRQRWSVIAAGICANLCSGSAYAFSVYKGPLKDLLHCRNETELALAFSLSIAFLPVGMLLSGKIADQRSPRMVVALGGTVFGAGMILASFSQSLLWLYITYGVMVSTGNGASYGAVVASAVKWFPDKRGLASGLVVGALGVGTVVIAPLAQAIIETPGLGIVWAFRILGTAFIVISIAASRFILNPPADHSVKEPGTNGEAIADRKNLRWPQMLARPRFWLLYVLYTCGAFSGLMITSQASPIAQELAGISPGASAIVVSVLGLSSASGRVLWGGVSDRLGRAGALALMFAITAVMMFMLPTLAAGAVTLALAVAVIALCYGGYLGTFPSLCADSFGSRNLAVNYGLLFSAFSLAGVLGPWVGARLREASGGYSQAFVAAGLVAVVGLLLTAGLRRSS